MGVVYCSCVKRWTHPPTHTLLLQILLEVAGDIMSKAGVPNQQRLHEEQQALGMEDAAFASRLEALKTG